jgi:hypothetical protein
MKRLILLFFVITIGLVSCGKKEYSITYKVTTEYPVDSLQIQTVTLNNESIVLVNSSTWTKTISNADISAGSYYYVGAIYMGQENPGKITVSIYQNDNLIAEGSQQEAYLISPVTYYSEPSCFYLF